jgi:hypothetical protein
MSKFLLNLLVQISKAMINSKIQILIQKFSFFAFGPANLTGSLGLWPSRPRWPLSSLGPNPSLPAQLARASVAYLWKYVFPFGSRLPSWPPPSHLSVKWAPAVSFVFSPAPPDPGRVTTDFHCAAPLRTSDAAEPLPPPSLPPLQIMPQPAVMSQITRPLKPPLADHYPAFTAPAPLHRPNKSHPDDPRSIPHLT